MLREAPRIAAHAFDTGDWLHVGLYTLLPGDPVLLFSGARGRRGGDGDGDRAGRAGGGRSGRR